MAKIVISAQTGISNLSNIKFKINLEEAMPRKASVKTQLSNGVNHQPTKKLPIGQPKDAVNERKRKLLNDDDISRASKAPKVQKPTEKERTKSTPLYHPTANHTVPKVAASAVPKNKQASLNHVTDKRLNIYVFGQNGDAQLGLGATNAPLEIKRPRFNPQLSAEIAGVVQVAVGGMHCVAITHDNKILTWGVNDLGALGRDTKWEGRLVDMDEKDSDSDSDSSPDGLDLNPYEATPTPVDSSAFPEGTIFTQVAAADSASFALTDTGLVYGWGTFRVSLLPNLSNSILTFCFIGKRRRDRLHFGGASPTHTYQNSRPGESDSACDRYRPRSRAYECRCCPGLGCR